MDQELSSFSRSPDPALLQLSSSPALPLSRSPALPVQLRPQVYQRQDEQQGQQGRQEDLHLLQPGGAQQAGQEVPAQEATRAGEALQALPPWRHYLRRSQASHHMEVPQENGILLIPL